MTALPTRTSGVVVGLLVGFVLLACTPNASAQDCANASVLPTRSNAKIITAATLCLLNAERTKAGLGALVGARRLGRAASGHSADMVRNRFFDHVSPRGTTPVSRARAAGYLAGAKRWTVVENLGWGGGRLATPVQMVASWMTSPGHRSNVLSTSIVDAGIGVGWGSPFGGRGSTYTADFGSRR